MDAAVAREKPYTLAPAPGGRLIDPVKLLAASLQDLIDNIGPYALAGVGQLLVTLPIVLFAVVMIYVVLGVVMFGGGAALILAAAAVGEDLAGLVLAIGYIGILGASAFGTFLLIGMMAALLAPINASMYRAIVAHQRGEGGLDIKSAFSTPFDNIGGSMIVVFTVAVASAFLAMFCYVPGILFGFSVHFAAPLVFIHKKPPMEAIAIAFAHTRAHLGWHAVYLALNFVVSMAAAYVPILGPAFLMAYHLRAYREVFGDGDEPVLDIVEA